MWWAEMEEQKQWGDERQVKEEVRNVEACGGGRVLTWRWNVVYGIDYLIDWAAAENTVFCHIFTGVWAKSGFIKGKVSNRNQQMAEHKSNSKVYDSQLSQRAECEGGITATHRGSKRSEAEQRPWSDTEEETDAACFKDKHFHCYM